MNRRIWSKLNYPSFLLSSIIDFKEERNRRGGDPLDRALFIYRSLIPTSLKDEVREEFCRKTGMEEGGKLPDRIRQDLTAIRKRAEKLRNPHSRSRYTRDQIRTKEKEYADMLYEIVLERADKYDLLLKSSHFFRERMEV